MIHNVLVESFGFADWCVDWLGGKVWPSRSWCFVDWAMHHWPAFDEWFWSDEEQDHGFPELKVDDGSSS